MSQHKRVHSSSLSQASRGVNRRGAHSRNSTPNKELQHLWPLFLWYSRYGAVWALLILWVIKQDEVSLCLSVTDTLRAQISFICVYDQWHRHLNVLLIINKANIACTKVRESCKSRLTTISPFPDTALYPFMKLFLPTLDNTTFWNTGIFWTAQALDDWYSSPEIQKVGKANSYIVFILINTT